MQRFMDLAGAGASDDAPLCILFSDVDPHYLEAEARREGIGRLENVSLPRGSCLLTIQQCAPSLPQFTVSMRRSNRLRVLTPQPCIHLTRQGIEDYVADGVAAFRDFRSKPRCHVAIARGIEITYVGYVRELAVEMEIREARPAWAPTYDADKWLRHEEVVAASPCATGRCPDGWLRQNWPLMVLAFLGLTVLAFILVMCYEVGRRCKAAPTAAASVPALNVVAHNG